MISPPDALAARAEPAVPDASGFWRHWALPLAGAAVLGAIALVLTGETLWGLLVAVALGAGQVAFVLWQRWQQAQALAESLETALVAVAGGREPAIEGGLSPAAEEAMRALATGRRQLQAELQRAQGDGESLRGQLAKVRQAQAEDAAAFGEALKALERERDALAANQGNGAGFSDAVTPIATSLAAATEQLRRLSQSMVEALKDSGQEATGVAAAIEEASVSVNVVAESTENLRCSATALREQMDATRKATASAVQDSDLAKARVSDLEEAVADIGRVAHLIGEIAQKTDLLALNATIESARAGEAGRGFAVVAGEVKLLAGQTATATQEIATRIEAIRDTSRQAGDRINAIAGRIAELDQIANEIAQAVDVQSGATDEISHNIRSIAGGTEDIAHTVVRISDNTMRLGDHAQEVFDSAQKLGVQCDDLWSLLADRASG